MTDNIFKTEIQQKFDKISHLAELHLQGHQYAYSVLANACEKGTFPQGLISLKIESDQLFDEITHDSFFKFINSATH